MDLNEFLTKCPYVTYDGHDFNFAWKELEELAARHFIGDRQSICIFAAMLEDAYQEGWQTGRATKPK